MNQPLTFIIAGAGGDNVNELRDALAADGRARLLKADDSVEQVSASIARLRPSAVIITFSGDSIQPTLSLVSRVAADFPETMLICASRDSSPDVILRSLRSGAREFLRLPVIAEEFRTVVDRAAEFSASQTKVSKKKGRLTAVFSSKGGCGTSFVAANLAVAMTQRTVLVDLNLHDGDLDLFLGVDPKFSIVDLVENRSRLDDTLLAGYLAPHSTNLSLLAAPREASSAEDIKSEHVYDVLQFLCERNDHVIVDTPHTFDAITLAALDQADDVLLVVTVDIPSIRRAQRALTLFERLGYPDRKVQVVINRWSKQEELSLDQVARYLGGRIIGSIPSDYRAAVNSINLGQPLIELHPSSSVAAEVRRIAASLSGLAAPGPAEATSRKGVLGSIFRRNTNAKAKDDGFERLNLRETLDKA